MPLSLDLFVAGLKKLKTPRVIEAKQTRLDGVFLIAFEHHLDELTCERLRRAGFVFRQHSHYVNYFMMRWQKPERRPR